MQRNVENDATQCSCSKICMIGLCLPAGQEAPGTNKRPREDLYKKFMSAEGISGRKPYGLRTRMIECRGWKRLEANRMFDFQQVSKKDFNAIFRRSLVFRILARFEDPRAVEGLCSEPYDVFSVSCSVLGCCLWLALTPFRH